MSRKNLTIIGIVTGLVIITILSVYLLWPSDEKKEEKGFFSTLFPTDEEELSFDQISIDDVFERETQDTSEGQQFGKLKQIINLPIVGAVFDGNKIKYIEKSTGHIYEINNNGQEKKQISINTIPKIFNAVWSKDTTKLILQYTDIKEEENYEQVKTFLINSLATSTSGVFLPLNTSQITVSSSENKIFYLLKDIITSGFTSTFENKNKKEILEIEYSNFLINWPQKNTITLQTKPSAFLDGFLYKLNPLNNSFTKLLGGIKGLTTLHSPNDNKIIYSESINKELSTKIYNTSDKKISILSYKTLPEKCIFSKLNTDVIFCAVPSFIPSAYYPDDWYKGVISFNDSIWKIDLKDGSTENLYNNSNLDIINIFLDKNENNLFFQNKKDFTLWSLDI